jgi:hypothetical protein
VAGLCVRFIIVKLEWRGVMRLSAIVHGTSVVCISENRHASAKFDFEKSGELSIVFLIPRRKLLFGATR